jgi:hypothetical protein
MDKIIFLDIDGVLATPEYLKDGQWALNPEKQKLLGEILVQTDAKIVLSSSWRYSTLKKTKEHMESEGFLFNDLLIGVTIRAYQFLERGTGIHLSIPRGVEIKQWIDTHIHSDNGKNWKRKKLGKDFTYVILDDESVSIRSSLGGAEVRNSPQTRVEGWTDEGLHERYCLYPERADNWVTAVS